MKRIKECPNQPHDPAVTKLCEECGWAGPRDSWPELPCADSSNEEDSDLSEDEEDDKDEGTNKDETEETKAKRLAANSPKIQIQLETTTTQETTTQETTTQDDSDSEELVLSSCNGSCQTRRLNHDASMDPDVSEVADKTQRVQL